MSSNTYIVPIGGVSDDRHIRSFLINNGSAKDNNMNENRAVGGVWSFVCGQSMG